MCRVSGGRCNPTVCKHQTLPGWGGWWGGGGCEGGSADSCSDKQKGAPQRGDKSADSQSRSALKEFSELQERTTQAEEEVRLRMKGRAGLEKVWSGEHMGPFGSEGAQLSPGEERREKRGIDRAGWSWRSKWWRRMEPVLRKFLVVCVCVSAWVCWGEATHSCPPPR